MKEITSKNNQIFKLFCKLKMKKYRDRMGMYLIEGENLLEEAVKNGVAPEAVLVRNEGVSVSAGEKIKSALKKSDIADRFFLIDGRMLDEVSETETSQGIIAAVRKPVFGADDYLDEANHGNIVVLDRLQDPGNIGTIIRTADAAGYSLVVALKGTADIFSPKVVRSAAGSLFRMPVILMNDAKELERFTSVAGKKLAATCLDGRRYYYEEDLSRDIALVIGNEGNGICRELVEISPLKIKIPMKGNIESLNAAVAAAIIMYEAVRDEK